MLKLPSEPPGGTAVASVVRALCCALAFLVTLVGAEPAAARYAALVIDADSGRVYFARNADQPNHPASLTKMMTLYMVFEALESKRLSLRQKLPVSATAARQPPSNLRLRDGQTITVEQAILALVTKSANDVAAVVAEALAGSESAFAAQMTRKARALGMSRTTFGNASGLTHAKQRSTARDMATLAVALRRDFPQHFSYFATDNFAYGGHSYRNHNNLLGRFDGTDGVKTGYTVAAGFNLVATVERSGHRLVGVVFGGRSAQTRDAHMRTILAQTFAQLEKAPHIITPERVPVPLQRPGTTTVAAADAGTPLPALKPVADAGAAAAQRQDETALVPAVAGGEAMAHDGWAVQLGAYSDYRRASQLAREAARHLSDIAVGAVAIEPLLRDGTRLYRARLIGLSEVTARRACADLERSHLPCVPVPPDDDA